MLYDPFRQFIADQNLDLSGHVLVGLSGGVDSVVLLDLVRRVASVVTCLHVNYGLRGDESEGDETFARDLCAGLSLPLVVVDARREMEEGAGSSVQALARQIRYREYTAEALKRGIELVLLGHHADDQVETILLNLFRGAGLNGLAGMPVVRSAGTESVRIVRPLLFARRHEIEEYAAAKGLRWRDDSSNEDSKYRRVVVRREIVPIIERHFGPAATGNILRMAELARQVLEAASGSRHPHDDADNIALALADLEGLPEVVRTGVILDTLASLLPDAPRSKAIAERIDRLAGMQTGRRVQLGGSAVIRERGALRFLQDDPQVPPDDDFSATVIPGRHVPVPGGTLVAHRLAERPASLDAKSLNVAYLDSEALEAPLTVTRWRDGDRITLFASAGSKKVSDLLTDEKVRTSDRRKVLVLRSVGRVAWVIGVRPSADFAVTDQTRSVMALIFLPQAAG